MASKKFWLGMLVMALMFGMTVIGCDNGTTASPPNTDPKSIVITGITGHNGKAAIIVVSSDFSKSDDIAEGEGIIANGSVTLPLVNPSDESPWTGNGSYSLMFKISGDQETVYTNGQTFNELGILSNEDLAKLSKYSITSPTSTIPFVAFVY